ncbi:DUF3880 domain-containing protein [Fundidesulfovibrio butyratiphilus]
MSRPSRPLRLKDELGVPKTLVQGHDLARPAPGSRWLVLGLGPNPASLAASLPPDATVDYLECPAFFDQAGPAWREAIPQRWNRLERLNDASKANILIYKWAVRLFPSFWGPVWAELTLPHPADPDVRAKPSVLVPAESSRLVVPEVIQALGEEGFAVRRTHPRELAGILSSERPRLYFSINLSEMDSNGLALALLARAEVPVAVWFVDNPFHCLSGIRSDLWKAAHLFVTDPWFVEPLRSLGATSVHHLPLAASPTFFSAKPEHPELAEAILFVGRSAFPGKDMFFSGLTLPEDLLDQARAMLQRGERPHFGWWAERLGVKRFWPGRQARRAGYGAEQSGQALRALTLAQAARTGPLVVHGDPDWKDLVDAPFTLLPEVDYYGPLAGLYASARYVLGTVSPLLPHGLTQRHFDVWAAGGCLLTDSTPGLDLFPAELTRPVTYRAPSDIAGLVRDMAFVRQDLIRAWRELLVSRHTYRHRVRTLLDRAGV